MFVKYTKMTMARCVLFLLGFLGYAMLIIIKRICVEMLKRSAQKCIVTSTISREDDKKF